MDGGDDLDELRALLANLDQPWRADAACLGYPTRWWYPEKTGARCTEDIARARALCQSCPVRDDCHDHADIAGERHGIWGGLSPKARQRHRHDHRPELRYRRKETA